MSPERRPFPTGRPPKGAPGRRSAALPDPALHSQPSQSVVLTSGTEPTAGNTAGNASTGATTPAELNRVRVVRYRVDSTLPLARTGDDTVSFARDGIGGVHIGGVIGIVTTVLGTLIGATVVLMNRR